MNRLPLFLAAALLVVAFSGCVPPNTGAASSGVQLMVNGRPVALAELIEAPMVRPAIQRYITFVTLQAEAAKRGVKIDQTELQKKVEEQKQAILSQGGSYEDFLKEQSVTADEVAESISTQMLFEGIVNSMVAVSEDDIKKMWDENKDQVLGRYLQENHLPESEKSKVTFEQAHDLMKKMATEISAYPMQEQVMNMLVLNSQVKVTGSGSPEKDKQLEDLILNFAKARIEKQQREEGAPNMPGLNPPPAGSSQEEGAASDKPAEETPPAEQPAPEQKTEPEKKDTATK